MEDGELLKAIYRCIEWDKLYTLVPGLSRQEVDELLHRLAGGLRPQEEGEARPAERAACDLPAPRCVLLCCDGASSGNPGPAGIGMVLSAPDGTELQAWGERIGRATNNVAEYKALIAGLSRALELGVREVEVRSDSELLVRQLTGAYKVKNAALKALHCAALGLLARFESWQAHHVPRVENSRADKLAAAQITKQKK